MKTLAIEQLPGAGRTDDPALSTTTPGKEDHQERTAELAEPRPETETSITRLRELREIAERLRAQLAALPGRQLQRVEDLDARALTLSTQREQISERLNGLPAPQRRRLGREHDTHEVERAHLTSALQAGERELAGVLKQREHLTRELGDPAEIRAERDGLQHTLTQTTREHTEARNELAEREVHDPSVWVRQALGDRPDTQSSREAWEQAVRQAARYRVEYEITDLDDALGPKPEQPAPKREWERARQTLERSERRLGREVPDERELDMGIGL
jgi:chromosome segregation ATPase